uniref:Uncharacterized protein n=1 Tax=Palpitomonas bilix TaxID=652834 RepID=A0A7S3FZX6_9EUKA|mmetsp:Transcript_10443/g.27359  ORF Transcript_10443/g.27359 Transcript_10443/m.27359 type:complete len:213 (+) Transcript_10443:338-976(+)
MDSTAQSVKAEDSNQQVVGTLKKKGTFSETNAATEHEVTLDYAFREISAVEELLKEVPKGFEKKEDGDGKEKKAEQDDIGYPTLSTKKKKDEDETTEVVKYNSKSVRINNNSLTTVATLPFVLNSILFKPDLVGWIDLSFNQLTTIEEVSEVPPPLQRTFTSIHIRTQYSKGVVPSLSMPPSNCANASAYPALSLLSFVHYTHIVVFDVVAG